MNIYTPPNAKVADFEGFKSRYEAQLQPFWDKYDFPDDPFFGPVAQAERSRKILLLSGPSRNGNHLLHSLLDNHPQIPRIPGEDSTINLLFECVQQYTGAAQVALCSSARTEFLMSFSSGGFRNKWRYQAEKLRSGGSDGERSFVWSGTQFRHGLRAYDFDYQDTPVPTDSDAFERALSERLSSSESGRTLGELIVHYACALPHLDPDYATRKHAYRYEGIHFQSGIRGPLNWLLEKGANIVALTPIRPFDSYYYSFASGYFGTDEIRQDLLKEAWEHWWHKTVDYAILKMRFPDRICIVNYDDLVLDTENAIRKACSFAGLDFDSACLTPTVLGTATKGNSSAPKDEKYRGAVYKSGLNRRLSGEFVPPEYWPFWQDLHSAFY